MRLHTIFLSFVRPTIPCLILISASVALGQATSFTYQGRLQDGGTNANGTYDFEFALYGTLSSGSQVGSTVSRNTVLVTNGIFNVTLDFGNEFPGANRFLEIRVRPTGGGAFTTLSPRQQINSTPYSIKSLSAENAVTAANATQLGGVSANQYVLTGDTRLSDARNPLPGSASYIQNATAPQASSNFNISGNGTVGGSLTGNVVNAATQFNINGNRILSLPSGNLLLGTGLGQFLTSGADNTFIGSAAGNLTNSGSFNTFVGGSAGAATQNGQANSFFGIQAGFNNTIGSNNSAFGAGANMGSANLSNATAIGARAFVTASNSLVLGSITNVNNATSNTNVGIGTTAPTERLHVVGNGLFTGNLTVNGTLNVPSFAGQFIQNSTTQQPTSNFNITGNGIIAGRLGVGVGNPVTKVHVLDNTSGPSAFFENGGAGQAIVAQGANTSSTLGGSEAGVLGIGNTGVTGRTFGNGDPVASIGVFGDAQSGSGISTGVWGQSKSSSGVGVRGWATSTTGSTIGIEGRSQSSSQSAIGVFGSGTTGVQGSGLTGVFGQSDTGVGIKGSAISGSSFLVPSAGVWGDSSSRTGVFGTSETLDGVHGTSASGVGGRFESQTGRGVEASGSTFGGFFTGRNGIGVDGGGSTHGGRFNSATGTGVHGFGGAFGGFFDTVGNGIGINVHSVGGVAILARSENTHALHADGSIFVNRWIEVKELRTGGSGSPVCRNSAFQLSDCSSSSIRYKHNIGSLDYGLDVVRKLRPITFDWRGDGTHDIGLVAEDVEKVAPRLTVYQDGRAEGVRYDKLGVVLISAVKEQQAQINEQQAQLKQQRVLIEQQAALINSLRRLVCRRNGRAAICRR